MENSKKAEKRRQEDATLNRALLWFAAAVILEVLVLLIDRYYINFNTSTESIALATAILTGLKVVPVVCVLGAAGCAFWGWKRKKAGGSAGFAPVLLGGVLLAIAAGCVLILLFHAAAVQLLYILVPAGAVLALAFYLYQREFFFSICAAGLGMLGLWLVRKNGGGHDALVYTYAVVAAIVLLAAACLVQMLRKSRGVMTRGERQYHILSQRTNFSLLTGTCLISLVALAAGVLLGSTVAYYLMFAILAWLIVLLVYYTVKMM